MIDMKTDAKIDAFVRRQIAAGRKFVPISDPPWIAAFETKLPSRLPPSFRSLILRYQFGPFQLSGIAFFGNRGDNDRDDLVVASLCDSVLVRVCQQDGFVQVGRPDTGTYDPVCSTCVVGRRMARPRSCASPTRRSWSMSAFALYGSARNRLGTRSAKRAAPNNGLHQTSNRGCRPRVARASTLLCGRERVRGTRRRFDLLRAPRVEGTTTNSRDFRDLRPAPHRARLHQHVSGARDQDSCGS